MPGARGPVRNPGAPWVLSPQGLERVGTVAPYIIGGDATRRKFFTGGSAGIVTEVDHEDYDLTTSTQIVDFTGRAEISAGNCEVRFFHVCPDGSYLVNVRDTDTLYTYLYHCPDPVADNTDWDFVLETSDDGAASQANGGRALTNHNFANVTIGSDWHVIFAGYPDTGSGYVRSWISPASSAATGWSVHWDAVTQGSTQHYRHFHSVYQNPYNDKIIYTLGDSDAQLYLVQGPAQTSWAAVADSDQATVSATAGWDGFAGAQRYRLIELAFIDEHIVWLPDAAGDDSEHGFWRMPADFQTAPTLVQQQHHQREGGPRFEAWSIGGGVLPLPSGDTLFSDYLTTTAGEGGTYERRFRLYVTRDGMNFDIAGYIPVENQISQAFNSFVIDDIIYMAGSYRQYVTGTNRCAVLRQSGHPFRPNKVLI